ncbi:MAG: hypothetical protein MAG453_00052 [Calditrichaeota bacterium]|nr:hypothetical protein [Calditrichota bacterium]
MTSTKPITRAATIVLAALLPVLWLGCEQGDDGPAEPVEDPGEALIAQALVVEGAMAGLLNEVRNHLNGAQAQLDPFDPTAESVLEELVQFSDGRVWASGLADTGGFVVAAHPEELDTLVGNDWSDRREIDRSLSKGGLAASDVLELSDVRTLIYARGIPGTFGPEGVVFAAIPLDTLLERSLDFAQFEPDGDTEFFVIEDDGRVAYDSETEFFGENLGDTLQFSDPVVQMATAMINPAVGDGSARLDLTGAPGGNGERHVGWVHLPLLNERFWVLAMTEPVDGAEG